MLKLKKPIKRMPLERVLGAINGIKWTREGEITFPHLNPGKTSFCGPLKELGQQPLKTGMPEPGL